MHLPFLGLDTKHKMKDTNSVTKQLELEKEEKEPLNGSTKSVTGPDDDATAIALNLYRLRRKNAIFSALLFIVTFLLMTCLTLLYLQPSASHSPPPSKPGPISMGRGCGSSIAQAKSRNCRFDILSKAWLPEECTDIGNEEYLKDSWSWNHTGWGIYKDRWQTQELTLDELSNYADSGLKWYGTEREHLVHCAWGLKRVLDAYWYEKKLDYIIQQLHHTTHCVDRLYMSAVKAEGLDIVLGKGNIRFGHC